MSSLPRRGFLGVVAAASLAGCNGTGLLEDEPKRLDGAALSELSDLDTPSIPETIPAPIETAYLDRTERRARDLLVVVPDPLEPKHVPNGAIREEIARARERARESLDRAASAETPFERMDALESARADAANASGAWRAVDEGYGRDDVVAAARPVVGEVREFRDELAYVGDDAVAAVLVYGEIERRARAAESEASQLATREFRRPANAPAVGEAAEQLERARASLDDARHLYDRHRGSLSSSQSLRGRLERATTELDSAVEAAYLTLPEESAEPSSYVDRDVSNTPAEWALRRASDDFDRVRQRIAESRNGGRFADAVLKAHEAFVARRTFQRIRDRVESGADFTVSSAGDVRTMRAAAVSAVESTAATKPRDLNRYAVHDSARQIGYVDDRFSRVGDDPTAEQVGHDAVEYVRIEATASSIPPVSERVVAAVRSAE